MKLLDNLFGPKYYVWRSTVDKDSLILSGSSKDLTELGGVRVKTFRAKTWKLAFDRFDKMRMKRK